MKAYERKAKGSIHLCSQFLSKSNCRGSWQIESYSAGTETVPKINQEAVRLMKQLYNIDMEQTQYSKRLNELPAVDIVITMGCNVNCPYLPCKYREDWGLEDPTGKDDKVFQETIATIEQKILRLKSRIENSK